MPGRIVSRAYTSAKIYARKGFLLLKKPVRQPASIAINAQPAGRPFIPDSALISKLMPKMQNKVNSDPNVREVFDQVSKWLVYSPKVNSLLLELAVKDAENKLFSVSNLFTYCVNDLTANFPFITDEAHYPVLELIVRTCIKAADHEVNPGNMIKQGFTLLCHHNKALAQPENIDQLKRFSDLLTGLAAEAAKNGENPCLMFDQGLRHIINKNPSLATIEHIDELKAYGDLLVSIYRSCEEREQFTWLYFKALSQILVIHGSLSHPNYLPTFRLMVRLSFNSYVHATEYLDMVARTLQSFRSLLEFPSEKVTEQILLMLTKARSNSFNIESASKEIKLLLKKHPQLFTEENVHLLAQVLGFAGTCAEFNYDPETVFRSIIQPALDNDPELKDPATLSKWKRMQEILVEFNKVGIFPQSALINTILSGEDSLGSMVARFKWLSQQNNVTLSLENETDIRLYSSVVLAYAKGSDEMPFPEEALKMIRKAIAWLKDNPKYKMPYNPLPTFKVSAKGDIEMSDIEFNAEQIDGHIKDLKKDISDITALGRFNFYEKLPLEPHESSQLVLRMLAYVQVRQAMDQGKMPPGFRINSKVLKEHIHRHSSDLDMPTEGHLRIMLASMPEFSRVIEAMYFVSMAAYHDSVKDKLPQKAEIYLDLAIHCVLAYGFMDDTQLGLILDRGDYQEKLEALRQIYQDRIRHIPDSTVPLPREAMLRIQAKFEQLKGEFDKIGMAIKNANVQEYSIVPAGMEALFRGYIGRDCSKGGKISFWAFNPNNMYYLIKKGNRAKGYIGLTSCVDPDGKKLLLVDTMNPCPPFMVEPILKALAAIAKSNGYDGLAMPINMRVSFNYPEVIAAIRQTDMYQKGERTTLTPQDSESWDEFEDILDKDTYHSLNVGTEDTPYIHLGRESNFIMLRI